MDINDLSETHKEWERTVHKELFNIYNKFFKNNPTSKITYKEFVVYCYNHTSKNSSHTRWI